EMSAAGSAFSDCASYLRVRMPQGQRAESHHPVDVFVSIHIVDTGPLPPLHEDRILTIVRRSTGGRASALDQHTIRALIQSFRLLRTESCRDLGSQVPSSHRAERRYSLTPARSLKRWTFPVAV